MADRYMTQEEHEYEAARKKELEAYMREQDDLCAQNVRCKVWHLDLERGEKNRDITFGRGRTGQIIQIKEGAVVDIPYDVYNQLMDAEAIDYTSPEGGGPAQPTTRKRYLVEVLPAIQQRVDKKTGKTVAQGGPTTPKTKYQNSKLADVEPGVRGKEVREARDIP